MKKRTTLFFASSVTSFFLVIFSLICFGVNNNSGKEISKEAAKISYLFKTGKYQGSGGTEMPYRYFAPTDQKNGSAKYPVILYLHGENEAGTNNEDQLVTTECATIWVEPDHLTKNPTYVLAPQIPKGTNWTSEPAYSNTLGLLNKFIEDHPAVDLNRIYIVGFSMGGTGVWNMILKNPDLFTAAMPISGNVDNFLGDYKAFEALKNFPVLVIHSIDDPVNPVSGSNNAMDALRAAGNQSIRANIWGMGGVTPAHDAWYPAFHNYEVIYNWLFEQTLERTDHGKISPTTFFTTSDLGNGVKQVWDYSLGTVYVVERADKAIIVDAGAGGSSIYQFIKENVLENKDVDLDILITHNHFDHIVGLSSFAGASQLKNVYVHKDDSESVKRMMGEDVQKVILVEDGDVIPFDGEEIKVISIPGHTWGCVAFWFENNLFSGDAIGSGDVWLGGAVMSVEDYIESVQHLLNVIGDSRLTVYGGHSGENRNPLTQEYIYQMLACAKGLVNGEITSKPYRRTIGGRSTLGYDGTYGLATIVHNLNNIEKIEGALKSIRLSEGAVSPSYAPYTTYYTANVDEGVQIISITADVLAEDYKSLRINGEPVESEEAYEARLDKNENRFSIEVVASDDTSRIYTLTISKGRPAGNRFNF